MTAPSPPYDYVEHSNTEVAGFTITDGTSTGPRPHDDVVWVGRGNEGRWLKPNEAFALADAISATAAAHVARHGERLHKVVIRATKDGYFIDRGEAQQLKFGKIDGEIRALPVEYLYNGSFGIGYYSRTRAIEVAYDWWQPVEVFFDEPAEFAEPQ